MKLISWNVNGVRAAAKKGLLEFMKRARADVICLQETKATPEDLTHLAWPRGYEVFWNSAEKKGYSGTAVFTRVKPKNVSRGLGVAEHDREGRVITAEFDDFTLVNVYQPNSQRGLTRLEYRTGAWDAAFLAYLQKLNQRKPVVFCGDLNVAHAEIDLANPKTNRRNAGFTNEERENFSRLLGGGLCRHLSRVRKARRPLHLVEPDGRLPRAEHRVAGRLFHRGRAPASRAQARLDPARGDGQRSLPGRSRAALSAATRCDRGAGTRRSCRARRWRWSSRDRDRCTCESRIRRGWPGGRPGA